MASTVLSLASTTPSASLSMQEILKGPIILSCWTLSSAFLFLVSMCFSLWGQQNNYLFACHFLPLLRLIVTFHYLN